jgi:hypothetical protein
MQDTSYGIKYTIFVAFLVYPGTTSSILRMLKCETALVDGSAVALTYQYLSASTIICDPSARVPIHMFTTLGAPIRMLTYRQLQQLAIVSGVLFCLGVPILFFCVLYYNRDSLWDMDGERDEHGQPIVPLYQSSIMIGQLYQSYEAEFYWFEVVECVRKASIIAISVFVLPQTPTQLAVGCFFVFLSITFYARYEPYADEYDDILALVCQMSIFSSMLLSCLVAWKDPHVTDSTGEPTAAGTAILLVLYILPFAIGLFFLGRVAFGPCVGLFCKVVICLEYVCCN